MMLRLSLMRGSVGSALQRPGVLVLFAPFSDKPAPSPAEIAAKAAADAAAAKAKAEANAVLLRRVRYESETYLKPPHARDELFPGEEEPVPAPKGSIALLSGTPKEYSTECNAIIHKPGRSVMQHQSELRSKAWRITVLQKPNTNWHNNLMGWNSSSNAFMSGGPELISFSSKESAVAFAEKMGYKYDIVEPGLPESFYGRKSYGHNFLNRHIEKRIKENPTMVAKVQFAHPERGHSAFVNLKHTPYGAKPSKTVSQTQWDSSPMSYKLGTGSWRIDSYEKRAELARKLGK